ncbi:BREX-1 system adenine-specific DNA-methyltransferase PglX [Roseivivax lentus]|uniref:type II restriction endonuclease subunit M n=1 Tax=Roseivivax lentus TaxID=633194 RepID=UPI0009706AE7|nr:type II restriction endonuclease subunit M [Roseivivax lentus]
MTYFIRALAESDKENATRSISKDIREGNSSTSIFNIDVSEFENIPGSPFAYWISKPVRNLHVTMTSYEDGDARTAKVGLQTSADDRFVRGWWEVTQGATPGRWVPFAKGESLGSFYGDIALVVGYSRADQVGLMKIGRYGRGADCYYRPGITWALRASRFQPRALPAGCIFSNRGQSCFAPVDELPGLLGLLNGRAVDYVYKMSLGRFGYPEFLVGPFLKLPVPPRPWEGEADLVRTAGRAWSLKRTLDTAVETSHAFHLPAALCARLGDYDPPAIEAELADIQAEIDDIAFDLYGFSDADRAAALGSSGAVDEDDGVNDASEDDDGADAVDQTAGLLSWAAGVAFGRFDWRLATGEREAPPEPEPFDPLPAKSPGMLPDDAEPFHVHSGILVDDQGHPNDLARLIEEVLARVEGPVPADVRRWLQRDFFKFHLGQYSKSRRKAPIYWPLSTSSGSYTLWLYYPSLTDQTLFTAVNDFIEPKLKQVGQDVAALRTKGSARSRDDEKAFEALQALELELIELRDTLLAIAQTYRPNHDDGVQITAAPLWQLFRLKPWQKVLKDTWAKLEKGDYDWAHLAMAYWPDRVREKCETDKSLAIAHDLEHLYVEPEPKPTKARGRKKNG